MSGYRPPVFGNTPVVVKNLLIINVIMFIGTYVLATVDIDLIRLLGLHYPTSAYFKPVQFITHMFMHGGLTHIFFNMFGLWMFGRILETVWGPQRFLIYYFVTGLGAAALHTLVNWYSMHAVYQAFYAFSNTPSPEAFYAIISNHFPEYKSSYVDFANSWAIMPDSTYYINQATSTLQALIETKANIPTVGASGAVFGILLAFGMLFPNTELWLIFPPIPIKAKYFVIGYGLIELYGGVMQQPGDNVAHFAHLGGMLFGFFMIRYWNSRRNRFY